MPLVIPGLVLAEPADRTAWLPRIGIHDVFRSGAVTASSTADGFLASNVTNGLTYDWWRSTGQAEEWIAVELDEAATCDYLAVAAHSLAGSEVTPQYHDGSTWVDAADPLVPADSQCLMWAFEPVVARQWRLRIRNSGSPVSVGVLYCGQAHVVPVGLPIGFAPPGFNERTKYETRRSVAGNSLGATVVSEGVEADFQFRYLPEAWVRTEWYRLQAELKRYPCFIAWSDKRGAGDVVFGYTSRDPSASYSSHGRMDVRLRIDGVVR